MSETVMNIPNDTPIASMMLKGDNSLIQHEEIGPIYDSDLQKDIWLDTAIRFCYDQKEPRLHIVNFEIHTDSFVEAFKEKKEECLPDFNDPLPDFFFIKYRYIMSSAVGITLKNLLTSIEETVPDHVFLYLNLLLEKPEDIYFSMYPDERVSEEDNVEITLCCEISEDGAHIEAAEAGPFDYDDEDDYILLRSEIEHTAENPEDYTITRYIIHSDDYDDFEDGYENCEWNNIEEEYGEEYQEKYKSRYEVLESVLFESLCKAAGSDEEISRLVDQLIEDGKIHVANRKPTVDFFDYDSLFEDNFEIDSENTSD